MHKHAKQKERKITRLLTDHVQNILKIRILYALINYMCQQMKKSANIYNSYF